jgi:hypothetical protein
VPSWLDVQSAGGSYGRVVGVVVDVVEVVVVDAGRVVVVVDVGRRVVVVVDGRVVVVVAGAFGGGGGTSFGGIVTGSIGGGGGGGIAGAGGITTGSPADCRMPVRRVSAKSTIPA